MLEVALSPLLFLPPQARIILASVLLRTRPYKKGPKGHQISCQPVIALQALQAQGRPGPLPSTLMKEATKCSARPLRVGGGQEKGWGGKIV